MMRTIILHGALASEFGASFQLDVKSPAEAVRALILQLKGFRQAFRDGHYRIIKLRPHNQTDLSLQELKLRLGRAPELHIVPVIAGSANALGKILTGVAIIGLAIAAPYALGLAGGLSAGLTVGGTTLLSFGQVAGFGALVGLGGISQLLSPSPKLAGGSGSIDRKESFLFGSAENVTSQGGPVPLVFGEFFVGSVVISAGLSTEEVGTGTSGFDGAVILRTFLDHKGDK